MGDYIAGQAIEVMTVDRDGTLGPFVNEITGNPVTPNAVTLKFQLASIIRGSPDAPGPTTTVHSGTPVSFDAYNPALAVTQDPTSLGFYVILVTTNFITMFNPKPDYVELRTVWESTDPAYPAVSEVWTDTIHAPAL